MNARVASFELLTRLLDAYERSYSYGCPGPWRRDILLKLDSATFPDAFAPNGRERHTELMGAALGLEQEGSVRISRHARGPLSGAPKELRLGPVELSRAYTSAATLGYEPLSVGLARLERHARNLASEAGSQTTQSFLESLASTLPAGDLASIGMGRSRFKQEWHVLIPALTASVALLEGMAPAWERVISERLFRDSKLLGRVRHHVINL